jgi:hypothetical protein
LGALTGSIFDTTRALVPEAQVTITNTDTGVNWKVKSSTSGYYRVAVPPGKYQVEAVKEGFKASLAKGIVVPVSQVITVDLTLQVGSATQSITVTTEAPLLTPSTAEVGGALSPDEYAELPVFISDGGRQPDTFIWNSMPGTTPDWAPNYGSISGGQGGAQTVLVDGVTIGRFDFGSDLGEQNPGMDAISEFKVQSANYSAEFGTTGGGVESFSIKSGTNQFHGSAFEVNNNPLFNANGWESNAVGGTKTDDKENNFGATLGGPIRKNKTFFFFDYEGDRKAIFDVAGLQSAPTASMLTGDFSGWLLASNPVANPGALPGQANYNSTPTQVGTDALGRPVDEWEIFDPTTTRTVAAGALDPVTGLRNNTANPAIIRDPFPNNTIPSGEFSTATAQLLSKFPTKGFVNGNLMNNLPYAGGTCCPTMNRNAYTLKMDEVINDKHKLSGTFMEAVRHRTMGTGTDTWFPWYTGFPVVHEKTQSVGGPQARILETWTVNDHSVNTFSLGYNRFGNSNNQTPDAPFGVAMGIPGVYAPSACFPQMNLANSDKMGTLKTVGYPSCPSRDPTESYSYQDAFATTRGKHSLKFGAQYLRYRYDTYEPGAQGGAFNFSSIQTELPGFRHNTGAAFASWIMGAVNAGSAQEFTTEPGYRAGVFSFFAQDDWRVNSRLTLNLGIRWEIPQPRTEAHNRMAEFDATAPDVMDTQGTTLPGALVWLGNCSTCIHRSSFQDWYFRDFAPRLGLAYQINSKTVFRGGYGISYQPPTENGWGPQTFFGFNQGYARFRQAGQLALEQPILYLTNFSGGSAPGPLGLAGVNQPVLPNMNPEGMNGYTPDFMPAHSLDMPLVQTWSAGLQYELPHKVLLEANYVGTRGTRLFNKNFGGDWNQANSKYMGLGDLLVDDFQGDLNNPTTAAILAQYGITKLPYAAFEQDNGSPGTLVANGLTPFPQYGGLINDQSSMGMSIYHSLQVQARKNSAHGLTFIAAYTLSKNISDSDSVLYNSPSGIQDFYNRKLERSITSFDFPQVLKLTWIYSLPLGSGQKWLNSGGVVNRVFGGWQVSANQRYGSGAPLSLSDYDASTIITPYVRPDVVAGVKQTLPLQGLDAINGTPYLNEAAFADPPLSPNNAFPLRVGTAPRYLPNIRGPAHQEEDFSLIKNTNITERLKFQIRGDFENVFNRVGRGNPDTGVNDGTFGLIYGAMNGPRLIQMSAHLTF